MTGANSFKKKRIRIGAYAPISHPDERHVKELAEAGVDFAILEFKLIKESAITPEFMSWFSKYGIDFEYIDFRPGFRQGQDMAREIGLYRQKFCGCIFSLEESKFRDKIYKSFEDGSLASTKTE